ncbi:MAG: cyclic nucleotide-binding domain-containing protein, partial [Planctomycetes bacterium]|nr:cyclic nucleotide-binding domain-containing protein [Planctomycetota bacterium]
MIHTILNSEVAASFSWEYFAWALLLGGISAISLPLGSALGLMVTPRPKVTAALTAFGGGALFCALAIELVAPTASALTEPAQHGHNPHDAMYGLLSGMLGGGILFFMLDQIINAHGGFLRKTASTIAYMSMRRKQRDEKVLRQLSAVSILREVPLSGVNKLVNLVRPRTFETGEKLFEQGDAGDALYFIVDGRIGLEENGKHFKDLEPGTVVGEIALLTGATRTATAKAIGRVQTLSLHKQDFDSLRHEFSELDTAARTLAQSRMAELKQHHDATAHQVTQWIEEARLAIEAGAELPTEGE